MAMSSAGEKVNWRNHIFFMHDSSFVKSERDPPEQAIIVFIAPVQVETTTQAYTCGGLIGMVNFAMGLTGGSVPLVFKMGETKMAHKKFGTYSLVLAGSRLEPDAALVRQLECIIAAFEFYHGSFDRIKLASNYDRKRFSNTMNRIFSALLCYFRPAGDVLQAGFNPTPYLEMPNSMNRYFAVASQLLDDASQLDGVLGCCAIHQRKVICSQLDSSVTNWILALLQPTQSTNYLDEDNRRTRRRGMKIRELMHASPKKLIRSREYRLHTYTNCFVGSEFVDFVIEKDEVRSRPAAVALGRRLLKLGIIQHVVNESDFKDDVKYYRFCIDRSGKTHPSQQKQQAESRPLILTGHGRDARTTPEMQRLDLPAGIYIIPAFIRPYLLQECLENSTWYTGEQDEDLDGSELREATSMDNVSWDGDGLGPLPEFTTPLPADQVSLDGSELSVMTASELSPGTSPIKPSSPVMTSAFELPFPEVEEATEPSESDSDDASTHDTDVAEVPGELTEDSATGDDHQGTEGAEGAKGLETSRVTDDPQIVDTTGTSNADPGESAAVDDSAPIDPTPSAASPPSTDVPPAEATEEPPLQEPEAEQELDMDEYERREMAEEYEYFLKEMGFEPYRWLLEQQGVTSKKSLQEQFSELTISEIDELLCAHDSQRDTHAFFSLLHAVGIVPQGEGSIELLNTVRGLSQVQLYLQGVGDTVFVSLVEHRPGNDALVKQLASLIAPQLDQLDDTMKECHREQSRLDRNDKATKPVIPPHVEDYNHIRYLHVTQQMNGWCNNHWSAKAQRLVPDSESDRAFVEAVVDMHDAFDAPTRFPSVSEMVLRKNYQSGVYGKRTFGRETFFQLRQPMNPDSRSRNTTRPFDSDVAQLQKTVHTRLAQDQDLFAL